MSERPFFSIVIPVYDRAAIIGPPLQSVLDQTFPDFECLVVDDGSRDGPQLQAVVDGLNDPRFIYLRRENGGGGAARNTGIDAARGKFIAFLDSDDLFLPQKLAQDYEVLANRKDPAKILLFSQVLVDRGGARFWIKPSRGPYENEDISEYLICHQNWTPTSTIVLPSALAKSIRFNEYLPFAQDTDFALRVAAENVKFLMHPVPLVEVKDLSVSGRVSLHQNYKPMVIWLSSLKEIMSPAAFHAYRGWHLARMVAGSNRWLALRFYLTALLRGAFPPALALRALLQILVPRKFYRQSANWIVDHFGRRK